jgi:hypothetical protein
LPQFAGTPPETEIVALPPPAQLRVVATPLVPSTASACAVSAAVSAVLAASLAVSVALAE